MNAGDAYVAQTALRDELIASSNRNFHVYCADAYTKKVGTDNRAKDHSFSYQRFSRFHLTSLFF
jgi:hypothetical protein